MNQKDFAERYAGKLVEYAGTERERQDVVVCGYPSTCSDFVTVRFTLGTGSGWRRSDGPCSSVVWLVDTDPTDPSAYWHVRISDLTAHGQAPVKYPNFPHKCTACGGPAYVGAYEVDCTSPGCVHFKGVPFVFKGIKT